MSANLIDLAKLISWSERIGGHIVDGVLYHGTEKLGFINDDSFSQLLNRVFQGDHIKKNIDESRLPVPIKNEMINTYNLTVTLLNLLIKPLPEKQEEHLLGLRQRMILQLDILVPAENDNDW